VIRGLAFRVEDLDTCSRAEQGLEGERLGGRSSLEWAQRKGPPVPDVRQALSVSWMGGERLDASTSVRRARLQAFARYCSELALLAAAYYGSGRVGSALGFAGPIAAIIWLPFGVGVAALYFRGLRLWPAVLLADLLLNDYSALREWVSFAQTFGNLVEVLLVALLLRRYARRGWLLGSIEGLAGMTGAIALGAAISATVGALSLQLGGLDDHDLLVIWRTWWLGDFSGALLVVPFALAWFRRIERPVRGAHLWEGIAVMATVALLSELAFSNKTPLAYIVFPALAWAAIRFGARGATLATNIAITSAVWNTIHHDGPFVYRSVSDMVLTTQIYIAVAEITTLVLAVVVTEREHYADQLDASRARLIVAGDTERRRIERNLHDGAQQRLVALAMRSCSRRWSSCESSLMGSTRQC
jgi:integral membrane sensor domain MASE1